jgi:aspartate kinase
MHARSGCYAALANRPDATATLDDRSAASFEEFAMPIVVQKYGGTSVGSVERIEAVADRVVRTREEGNDVIVVVSAMGDSTDELMWMARGITEQPDPRELDMLLTAGERIAMSLLGIAIIARGCRAASYTGSQAGIITDTQHGKAKIVDIRPGRIRESLTDGNVVIVAGFQGVSTSADVTTLGRGGSDTTAVALAAALEADFCEIYTDVRGVFTADPRVAPSARLLARVSYEEMLELAASGAKVLQLRSVEYARRNGVRVHVRSSFDGEEGTWIEEVADPVEDALISGVALERNEAKITIVNVPDRPGAAAAVFKAIASEGISVDMIVQNVSHDGSTDLSFTITKDDLPRLESFIDRVVEDVGAARYTADDRIAKISLVGAGMRSHPGVAADMFDAMASKGINIEMISTSSIRVSCVIRAEQADDAVRVVHERFNLGADAQQAQVSG